MESFTSDVAYVGKRAVQDRDEPDHSSVTSGAVASMPVSSNIKVKDREAPYAYLRESM